ncbi:MAG: hypothetical protein ACE5JM_15385, partial [Armatimonadota bacterium]
MMEKLVALIVPALTVLVLAGPALGESPLAKEARERGSLTEMLGPAPIENASAEDLAAFEPIRMNCMKWKVRDPMRLATSGESYFWSVGSRLTGTMNAYEYSRDPELLEAFSIYMDKVLADRYVHPTQPDVWIGWYHYQQGPRPRYYMPIHGALVYYKPALRFVAAVRADEKLKARYGEQAEKYFEDITQVEFRAWDKRDCWHDFGDGTGWYTKLKQYPDPVTEQLHPLVETEAGTTLAYNKVHAMIEAFCLAYRMTGDAWYRERIEKCERFFRKRWREDAEHVEWNYRDFSGPWDYRTGEIPADYDGATYNEKPTWKGWFIHPKGGYYGGDLRAIVAVYNIGLVFTRADMEKLVKTNLEFMWNGETTDPQFRGMGGIPNQGALWHALSQFSPKVCELWRAEMDAFEQRKGKPSRATM